MSTIARALQYLDEYNRKLDEAEIVPTGDDFNKLCVGLSDILHDDKPAPPKMRKIRVRMSETVNYRFEMEVEDDADEEAIHDAAEEYFVQHGPRDEWETGVEDRGVDGWEEIQ